MTRSELVTEFRDWIDQRNTAIVGITIANREINRAYRELRGKINDRNYRFYFKSSTVTTVAATPFLAYPSNCVSVNKLVDSDNNTLLHRDLEAFNHTLASAKPERWDTTGRNLIFSPIPDTTYTYTIYYTYDPGDMGSDIAVPIFVPGYEDVIAIKAAINSKMIRDEAVRDMAQNVYVERLLSLLTAVGTGQTSSSRRVIQSNYDMGDI